MLSQSLLFSIAASQKPVATAPSHPERPSHILGVFFHHADFS